MSYPLDCYSKFQLVVGASASSYSSIYRVYLLILAISPGTSGLIASGIQNGAQRSIDRPPVW